MGAPVDAEWVASIQGALDGLKSMRLRYANGALLVVPTRSAHFSNRFGLGLWARSIPGVRGAGSFSLMPAIAGYAPEPDFALIHEPAHAPGRTSYQHDEVLFVAEIVSTESEQRYYVHEPNHYANAGIPSYLVLDMLTVEWTLFTQPRNDTYMLTSSGTFGSPIPVEIAGQPRPIDSSAFEHL
jgi:Uma2 family endonuclease